MNILLDTNMLIWLALEKLPIDAKKIILDNSNNIYFSPINLWEIAIKRRIGRSDFDLDPNVLYSLLIEHGYLELKVNSNHTLMADRVSIPDNDPFDKLLISQSIVEDMTFITSDKKLSKCPHKNIHYIKKP